MSLAFTRATIDPAVSAVTYSDVITGRPARVPPFIVTPGYAGWPSGLSIKANANAVVEDIIHTPDVGALLAAINAPNTARISALIASWSVPVDGIATAPFVMDAGETPATATLSGSMKSMSKRS